MVRVSSAAWTVVVVVLVAGWSAAAWAQDKGEVFWSEGGSGRPKAAMPGTPQHSFAELADRVGPAVLSLEVRIHEEGALFPGHPGTDGLGQGSGFLITADGLALTNHHVVEKAEEIGVILADGRRFSARVVGSDASTDVALIQLEGAKGLPVLPLGDSEGLRVGDWVVAIGSPLGLQSSVTAGIVSATGRRQVNPGRTMMYSNFIQTDASINPGNSGGPLLNVAGEVIAINSAVTRLGQGIGFAIPINMVKTILPTLRKDGFVRRSWIGIMIQELDRDLARSFGLERAQGALVTDVVTGGPGDRAGLKPGDVILALDGKHIETSEELPWLASVAGVGHSAELTVWRDAGQRKVRIQLAEMPGGPAGPASSGGGVGSRREGYGLEVQELGKAHGRGDQGVVVMRIEDWSPARGSGLQQGDVIVEVGDAPVVDVDGFKKALAAGGARGVIRVKARRARSTYFFAFPQLKAGSAQ